MNDYKSTVVFLWSCSRRPTGCLQLVCSCQGGGKGYCSEGLEVVGMVTRGEWGLTDLMFANGVSLLASWLGKPGKGG